MRGRSCAVRMRLACSESLAREPHRSHDEARVRHATRHRSKREHHVNAHELERDEAIIATRFVMHVAEASQHAATRFQHRPQRLVAQGSQGIDARHRKHFEQPSKSLDEDRFTPASRVIASRFTHDAKPQVLYAGSNVESKSHQNENFHEQTLLTLMKRWYKPI
jgi:hypothetical protein